MKETQRKENGYKNSQCHPSNRITVRRNREIEISFIKGRTFNEL